VAQLTDAGLADARHFLVHRLPWDLARSRFIDFQRRQIEEVTLGRSLFPAHLRHVALELLADDDTAVVRRALTCLAIVGLVEDVLALQPLLEHLDSDIRKDAKTAIFEIQHGI
jgi:hypothetical protein